MNERSTNCKACGLPLGQVNRGHRAREYCNDTCKQLTYRTRKEEGRRQEVRARWADYPEQAREQLERLMCISGCDLAKVVTDVLDSVRELMPRPAPMCSREEAEQRARCNNYIGANAYLESTGRLLVELLQTVGQGRTRQIATAITAERGAEGGRLRRRIAELERVIEAERGRVEELERKVALQQTTSDEIDAAIEQHHLQLGQLLMACGKRLKYRELPLSIFYKNLFPWLFNEADLYDIKAGRFSWDTASSDFSPEGLVVAIVYVTYLERVEQILKQERGIAADQVWRYKLEAEDAQRDEREARSRYYRMKERLEEAERELARYRQLCDLDDRQCLLAQAAALGAQIGYTSLLAINPPVRAGEASWSERLQQADTEDLARIITVARHFAENLVWLEVHDELQRAQRRIVDLECQVAEYSRRAAVSSQTSA